MILTACAIVSWAGELSAQSSVPDQRGTIQLAVSPAETARSRSTAGLAPSILDNSPDAIEQRLRADVTYLSSDELEGRGLQTAGLELAAEFIAREFRAAGLQTSHYNGTPFHEFKLYSAGTSGAVQSLALQVDGRETESLALGHDYTSLMVTPTKGFQWPVVFVGYGISDRKRGYDDYAGVDVRGKAVIVLRHEPQLQQPDSVFDGTEVTDHSYVLTKLRTAYDHGATAVILCTDRATLSATGGLKAGAPHDDPLLEAELHSGIGTESLPIVHCRRAIIERWIQAALGRRLEDIERQIDATLAPQSAPLPSYALTGRVAVVRPGRTVRNVVGVSEGRGELAQETIVVGAHYDHLGRGGWGSFAVGSTDEIHNGADDNASGTAVLIEAARQWAASTEPHRRRVVFIAFTAEELGLYGSKRYVLDPLFPLDKTVAMLNLDMVGRLNRERLTVYGTGTAQEWSEWLADAAKSPALQLHLEPSGFGPSDHAPFYERGVPVLHFFTGFHPEYHRPGDDAERLNIPGMRRVTALLNGMLRRIDTAAKRPHPSVVDQPFQLAGVNSINGVTAGAAVVVPPRLGILMQETDGRRGVGIRQVQADGLAHRAGLQPGDVIVRIGGRGTRTIEDLHQALADLARETPIAVDFERGSIPRSVDVVFSRSVTRRPTTANSSSEP